MNSKTTINREVNVTAVYFRNKKNLKTFPKRMEFDGHEYEFIESGLQYRVVKDNQELRFFDMSDGKSDYRLRCDRNSWTLVSINKSPSFSSF